MLAEQKQTKLTGRVHPSRLSLDTTYRLGPSVARLLASSISCYRNLVSSASHDTMVHVWQLAETRPGVKKSQIQTTPSEERPFSIFIHTKPSTEAFEMQ